MSSLSKAKARRIEALTRIFWSSKESDCRGRLSRQLQKRERETTKRRLALLCSSSNLLLHTVSAPPPGRKPIDFLDDGEKFLRRRPSVVVWTVGCTYAVHTILDSREIIVFATAVASPWNDPSRQPWRDRAYIQRAYNMPLSGAPDLGNTSEKEPFLGDNESHKIVCLSWKPEVSGNYHISLVICSNQ